MPSLKWEGSEGSGEAPAIEAIQVLGEHHVRQGQDSTQPRQQAGKLSRGAAPCPAVIHTLTSQPLR